MRIFNADSCNKSVPVEPLYIHKFAEVSSFIKYFIFYYFCLKTNCSYQVTWQRVCSFISFYFYLIFVCYLVPNSLLIHVSLFVRLCVFFVCLSLCLIVCSFYVSQFRLSVCLFFYFCLSDMSICLFIAKQCKKYTV